MRENFMFDTFLVQILYFKNIKKIWQRGHFSSYIICIIKGITFGASASLTVNKLLNQPKYI